MHGVYNSLTLYPPSMTTGCVITEFTIIFRKYSATNGVVCLVYKTTGNNIRNPTGHSPRYMDLCVERDIRLIIILTVNQGWIWCLKAVVDQYMDTCFSVDCAFDISMTRMNTRGQEITQRNLLILLRADRPFPCLHW